MRLLYLIVDDLEPTEAEIERLTTAGQSMAPAGMQFAVAPIAFGPRSYYESAVGFALCVPGILHAVRERAQRHDAFLLGCFGDPGLRAAREVSPIPVVGAAEAATAYAQLVAARYGIVTIMDGDVPELDALLAQMEVAHRCVGVDAIDMPFYSLVDDPERTLARLERAAGGLCERGAQAIVLGCMSLGFGGFDVPLAERLGVPVINPVRAGIAAAHSLQLLGVGHSRRWTPLIEDTAALDEHLERAAAPALPGG